MYGLGKQRFSFVWNLKPELLVRKYALYLEVMQHWRKVLPGRVIDIRYEDLVEEPEIALKMIIQAIGAKWDPTVLNYHEANRPLGLLTISQSQVRKKLTKKHQGAWRKYASHLGEIAAEWQKHLPKLRQLDALPFKDQINWEFDVNWPYEKGALARKKDVKNPAPILSPVKAPTVSPRKFAKVNSDKFLSTGDHKDIEDSNGVLEHSYDDGFDADGYISCHGNGGDECIDIEGDAEPRNGPTALEEWFQS
jgi:hypothetical protein